jgi:hypothetical protein
VKRPPALLTCRVIGGKPAQTPNTPNLSKFLLRKIGGSRAASWIRHLYQELGCAMSPRPGGGIGFGVVNGSELRWAVPENRLTRHMDYSRPGKSIEVGPVDIDAVC